MDVLKLLGKIPGGISWKWLFSWPDAGNDQCLKCGVIRRQHQSQDHKFAEQER